MPQAAPRSCVLAAGQFWPLYTISSRPAQEDSMARPKRVRGGQKPSALRPKGVGRQKSVRPLGGLALPLSGSGSRGILNRWDEVALTLQREPDTARFEAARARSMPTTR